MAADDLSKRFTFVETFDLDLGRGTMHVYLSHWTGGRQTLATITGVKELEFSPVFPEDLDDFPLDLLAFHRVPPHKLLIVTTACEFLMTFDTLTFVETERTAESYLT